MVKEGFILLNEYFFFSIISLFVTAHNTMVTINHIVKKFN